jgi:heat shock protein HslJ
MKFVSLFLTTISLFLFGLAITSAQEEPTDPLAGTRWQLVSYAETPVLPDSTISLIFGDDMRVSGSSGCNTYGTAYSINEGAIAFEMAISTRMACMTDGVMEQESAYLQALPTVTTYEIVDDQLILTYDGGQLIFMALKLENTEWRLVSYGASDEPITVIGENPITLTFGDDMSVSGSGGCNTYGGGYAISNSTISFSDVFYTEMACMGEGIMAQESAYLGALGSTSFFVQTDKTLRIDYADGQLTFERVYRLANTSWQLVSFDDVTPVVAGSVVTITFGDDMRVSGSGGCNSYGGRYSINEGAIVFSEVISTLMACVDETIGAQEGSFFFGLEKATTYEISADELVIYYGDGAKMTFTRIENPYSE